jgi:RecB family endonuclease NucS
MSTPEKQKCDTIANLLKTKHEQVKKQLNRRLTTPPERIPEKYLEDYLEKNLEVLEQGLKFKSRQAILELGRLDIVAENVANEMVLIELKTDPSEYIGMDKLCGQISRYFNQHGETSKMYLIVPFVSQKQLSRIRTSLKHWIQDGRVRVYQFDYQIYRKKFIFERVVFDI